jgi:hypothetical protein
MNTTTVTEDYPTLTQVAVVGNTQRQSMLSTEAVKALGEIARLRDTVTELRATIVANRSAK